MNYPFSDPSDRFYGGFENEKTSYTSFCCPICGERIEVGSEVVRIGGEAVYHKECFESEIPWELLRDVGVILSETPERWC